MFCPRSKTLVSNEGHNKSFKNPEAALESAFLSIAFLLQTNRTIFISASSIVIVVNYVYEFYLNYLLLNAEEFLEFPKYFE